MNVNLPEEIAKAIIGVLLKEVGGIKDEETFIDATSSILSACTAVIANMFDKYTESDPNSKVVEMLRNMADSIEEDEGGDE